MVFKLRVILGEYYAIKFVRKCQQLNLKYKRNENI